MFNFKKNAASGEKTPASSKKYTWKHQLWRLPWLLLIPLGLLLPKLASLIGTERIERVYAREIYPVIASVLGAISSIFPFSLAEVLIIGIVICLAALLILRIFKLVFGKLAEKKRNRIHFFSYIISLGIFAGAMLNLFYAFWGFNHYRASLSELMELDVKPRPKQELAEVYRRLTLEAIELRKLVDEDEDGVFTLGKRASALKSVQTAYNNLGSENELFALRAHPAKTVLFSTELSKLNIAGIYIPYLAEPNVNAEQPDLYLLADAAHETAHYMGFAKEEDANFLAVYASFYSDDPNLNYSAHMLAISYVGSSLYATDQNMYFEIRGLYSDGMERDLSVYREYYKKYEKHPAKKINDKINDTYLKYNGEQSGIKSYGRMVDLLLAYYEKAGK